MDTLLAILLLSFTPHNTDTVMRDRVDLIEINHFYDDKAKLVFTQTIFYDWDETYSRYMIIAWRLVKSDSQIPIKNWSTGKYDTIWWDGDTLRVVNSNAVVETQTQHDPELCEREFLPKEKRRELSVSRLRLTLPVGGP